MSQEVAGPAPWQRIEYRNVKAITLLKCYNITTEQHWDLITTIRIKIRIFP